MFNDGHAARSLLRIERGPVRRIVYTQHKEKGFGYRTPMAEHREHELIYLDYGRMTLMLGDRAFHLETGDALIIPGGTSHRIHGVSKKPFNFLNIVFLGSLPKRMAGRILHLQLEERRLLLELKEESELNLPLAGDIQLLKVNEFLLRLTRHRVLPPNQPSQEGGENRVRYRHHVVQKALDYLDQRSNRPLDTRDIAAHIGFSASHVRALIRKETGRSLRQHARDLRIETAKRLLRESIDNVTTICYRVGYASTPHFCTVFKKTVGMTPLEYSRSLGLPKTERPS